MAAYAYRCAVHGEFELRLAMGTAPARGSCPECLGDAARVFSAPRLSLGSRTVTALIDHTEKSRDEPEVVRTPAGSPRRRTPMAPPNPALARLPRP
ncbi:MAG: zinc ribbon domain-containing protein [Pseudonocardia sp.]|nr:zinc ribbon domain-containing protein [Pseudonocardia sp.]